MTDKKTRIFVVVVAASAAVERSLIAALGKEDELWRKEEMMTFSRRKYVIIKKTKVTEKYMKSKMTMVISIVGIDNEVIRGINEMLKKRKYRKIKEQSKEYITLKKTLFTSLSH